VIPYSLVRPTSTVLIGVGAAGQASARRRVPVLRRGTRHPPSARRGIVWLALLAERDLPAALVPNALVLNGSQSDASIVRNDMIVGRTLVRQRDRPEVHSKGRLCGGPGCTTTLSVYNPDTECFLHERSRRESPLWLARRIGR
jgi:hypothetical protein